MTRNLPYISIPLFNFTRLSIFHRLPLFLCGSSHPLGFAHPCSVPALLDDNYQNDLSLPLGNDGRLSYFAPRHRFDSTIIRYASLRFFRSWALLCILLSPRQHICQYHSPTTLHRCVFLHPFRCFSLFVPRCTHYTSISKNWIQPSYFLLIQLDRTILSLYRLSIIHSTKEAFLHLYMHVMTVLHYTINPPELTTRSLSMIIVIVIIVIISSHDAQPCSFSS